MKKSTKDNLNDIAFTMTEDAQRVFSIVTKALMKAFPDPGSIDNKDVIAGLQAAINVVRKVIEDFPETDMN